jgi:hypothetical protein
MLKGLIMSGRRGGDNLTPEGRDRGRLRTSRARRVLIAALPPMDALDREIDAASAGGRPIDMVRAFPAVPTLFS